MKYLRWVPLAINLFLFFGLNMESSASYFPYTIAFLILGHWYFLLYGAYLLYTDATFLVVVLAGLFLFFQFKRKSDNRPLSSSKENSSTRLYRPGETKSNRNNRSYDYDEAETERGSANRNNQRNNLNEEDSRDSYSASYTARKLKNVREDQMMDLSDGRGDQSDFTRDNRGSSRDSEDEYWRQKKLEEDAHFYRRNGGERWKVEAADDALGRTQVERDHEDEQYERTCSGCNEPESQCSCCRNCNSDPCQCCDECGQYNCRCCRNCNSDPCQCCDECGQYNCRCCRNCNSDPCECCDECGYYNCRCCSNCDRDPCQCCSECGEYNCRCCYRCGRYPCDCD